MKIKPHLLKNENGVWRLNLIIAYLDNVKLDDFGV